MPKQNGAKFNVIFDAEMTSFENGVKQMQKEINKLSLPKLQTNQIETAFDKVNEKIKKYRETMDRPVNSSKDLDKQTRAVEEVEAAYNGLYRVLLKVTDIDPSLLKEMIPSSSIKNITKMQQELAQIKLKEQDLTQAKKKQAEATEKLNKAEKEKLALQKKNTGIQATSKNKETYEGKKNYETQNLENLKKQRASAQNYLNNSKDPEKVAKWTKEIKSLDTQIATSEKNLQKYETALSRIADQEEFAKASTAYSEFQKDLNKLNKEIEEMERNSQSFEEFKSSISGMAEELGIDLSTINSYEQLEQVLARVANEEATKFEATIKNLDVSMDRNRDTIQGLTKDHKDYGESAKDAENSTKSLKSEVEQFTSRFTRFFTLASLGDAVVKAVRNAVTSIKELDKAMTETAVVTDFTVGDMWEQLPEYTKQANQLGVATKEAYDAATLYYQQGLDTNTVQQLTNSTLRMARIASLDAATATDRMTNALRGFNMELDQANAERVADVYSELAAVSATDVNELSVAMTKTASIAHSANMEFENTAAFLAQMLETTRESAETAGTALKTVVGRFTEVKELYTKGQLTGSDEEGEIIDVNKVSEALRTAGIDMNKFFVGEVGLDEIFNELAEKWDSLSIVQQRYIATQAAGSRQQSRFIAMLGDYDRLLELQQYAYNADGASAEQYEKTLDSLETKVQKLKNAWNEFTMKITNQGVVKGIVDIATAIINAINNIIDALSFGNETIESIMAIILSIGGVVLATLATIKTQWIKKLNDWLAGIIEQATGLAAPKAFMSGQETGYEIGLGIAAGIKESQGVITEAVIEATSGAQIAGDGSGAIVDGKFVPGGVKALKNVPEKEVGKGSLLGRAKEAVGGIFGKIKAMLPLLGKIFLVVAAIGAIIFALYQFVYKNSLTYELKQTESFAKSAQIAAESAQEAYDNLLSNSNNYNQLKEELGDLVEGTTEFKNKLVEANDAATQLLKDYPDLEYTVDVNTGLINIDNESLIKKQREVSDQNIQAQAASQLSNAQLEQAKYNKKYSRNNIEYTSKGAKESAKTIWDSNKTGIKGVYNNKDWFASTIQQNILNEINNGNIQTQSQLLDVIRDKYSNLDEEIQKAIFDETVKVFNEKQNSNSKVKMYKDSAISQALSGQGYESNTIDTLKNILSSSYDNAITEDKIKEKKKGKSADELRAEYKQITGITDEALDEIEKNFEGSKKNNWSKLILSTEQVTQMRKNASDIVNEFNKISGGAEYLKRNLDFDYGDFSQFGKYAETVEQDIKDARASIDKYWSENMYNLGEESFKNFTEGAYTSANAFKKVIDQYSQLEGPLVATVKVLNETTSNTNLSDFMSEISNAADWNSAIDGARQLNEWIESTNPNLQFFAANLIEAKGELYNTTAQAKELGRSLSEDDLKAIDGASSILDLSKSNKKLGQMMKNTSVSASTMALYLEQVRDGVISADSVTEDYVETLDKLYAAQNTISDSLAFIEAFDAGESGDTIGDAWAEYYDKIDELVSNGAYGDHSLHNYIKAMVGEENWTDYLSQVNGNYEKAVEHFKSTIDNSANNLYDAWVEFSKKSDYTSVNGDGSIGFDIDSFGDVETLRAALMEKLQVSREYADAMIASAQTYSADLESALQGNATEDALNSWMDNNLKAVGEKKVLLEKDLTSLAGILKKDVTQVKKELEQLSAEGKIDFEISANFDENGKLNSDIMEALKNGGTIKINADTSEAEEKFYDLDLMYDYLTTELKMDDAEARNALGQFFEETYDTASKVPFQFNGETLEGGKEDIANAIASGERDEKVSVAGKISALETAANYTEAISAGVSSALASIGKKMVEAGHKWTGNYISDLSGSIDPKDTTGELRKQINKYKNDLSNFGSAVAKSSGSNFGGTYLSNFNTTQNNSGYASAFNTAASRESQSSDSGSGSDKEWENDFDWLQNLLNDIEANTKEMTQLQDKMNDILEEPEKYNIQDLVNNLDAQITNLSKQKGYNDALIANRTKQIDDVLAQFPELAPYISKNENGTIDIVYDAIETLDKNNDSERGELLKTVFDYAMGAADEVNSAIEENLDIDNQARALKKQFQDIATNTLSKIRESYVKYAQMQIDEEKAVSDAIKDANDELIDSLNQALEKDRQARENAEKEKELTNKEQRLAYLRMDTSGGNQLEIMQLEKELNDERQDFTDTLIDQKISELEEQNDLATEQRERQIELAESQLEWAEQTGEISKIAEQLLQTDVDSNGKIIAGSELETILKSNDNWTSLTKEEKLAWADQMNSDILATRGYLQYVYQAGEKAFEVKDDVANKTMQDVASKLGVLTNSIERINNSSGSSGGSGGSGYAGGGYSGGTGFSESSKTYTRQEVQDYIDQHNMREGDRARWGQDSTFNAMYQTLSASDKQQLLGADNSARQWIGQTVTLPPYPNGVSLYDENKNPTNPPTTTAHVINIDDVYRNAKGIVTLHGYDNTSKKYWYYPSGTLVNNYGRHNQKTLTYKTGGLADFTGPAWLDGTKSKPEMVLNATDTENFIALKDILGQFMNSRSQSQSQPKEMVNNFTINVDEISNDYDVDKLVQRVKDDLYEIGSYRNVTHVNRLR